MIKGLYTALVTPFDTQGQLDEEALRRLINFQVAAGVEGIVVLGTTGEAPTLTEKEKEKIVTIAKEETRDKIQLMVGTGSYSTKQTIENILLAQDLGADSVLVVSPYYNKPTQTGLFLHFKAISESSHIPIMIYNNPGRTGQNIQTDTLMRLAELPHVCGVKEASGHLIQIMDIIEKIGKQKNNFSVMSGDDLLTLPSMLMGGHGIISVIGNLLPLQMKALVKAAICNLEEARNIHYSLAPFMKAAFIEANPIPIKAAMELSGIHVGECRLPLCHLLKAHQLELQNLLTQSPLLSFVKENKDLFPKQ